MIEEISQRRPKITNICQISIKIQVPQYDIQRDIFENLDADNQMLGTYCLYEQLNSS